MSPEEFKTGVQSGTVVGHVGFIESIHMIADCLGWRIDEIKQERVPIISSVVRKTPYIMVQPGQTAGSKQTAYGWMNGKVVITLEHPQEVRPELEGTRVRDRIVIEGEPKIQLDIVPEIAGGVGTIGMAVNMIPHVISAAPGLLTMKDLPIPYLWSEIRC
jgi:4-hydroxy-tetrahydrodipicolinate reductase